MIQSNSLSWSNEMKNTHAYMTQTHYKISGTFNLNQTGKELDTGYWLFIIIIITNELINGNLQSQHSKFKDKIRSICFCFKFLFPYLYSFTVFFGSVHLILYSKKSRMIFLLSFPFSWENCNISRSFLIQLVWCVAIKGLSSLKRPENIHYTSGNYRPI